MMKLLFQDGELEFPDALLFKSRIKLSQSPLNLPNHSKVTGILLIKVLEQLENRNLRAFLRQQPLGLLFACLDLGKELLVLKKYFANVILAIITYLLVACSLSSDDYMEPILLIRKLLHLEIDYPLHTADSTKDLEIKALQQSILKSKSYDFHHKTLEVNWSKTKSTYIPSKFCVEQITKVVHRQRDPGLFVILINLSTQVRDYFTPFDRLMILNRQFWSQHIQDFSEFKHYFPKETEKELVTYCNVALMIKCIKFPTSEFDVNKVNLLELLNNICDNENSTAMKLLLKNQELFPDFSLTAYHFCNKYSNIESRVFKGLLGDQLGFLCE